MNKTRFSFDPRRPQQNSFSLADAEDCFGVMMQTVVGSDQDYRQMCARMYKTFGAKMSNKSTERS